MPATQSCRVNDAALRGYVGYNMKRAFHLLQGDLQRALKPHGLRMITFSALAMIESNPGLRPSQIAESLAIERANLVVILDELEKAGWITRTPSPEDRRAHALNLTQDGAATYAAARQSVDEHDLRMLVNVPEHQRATFIELLRTLEATVEGKLA
jgi:DNA-binding MarR family transcriptional regulator